MILSLTRLLLVGSLYKEHSARWHLVLKLLHMISQQRLSDGIATYINTIKIELHSTIHIAYSLIFEFNQQCHWWVIANKLKCSHSGFRLEIFFPGKHNR